MCRSWLHTYSSPATTTSRRGPLTHRDARGDRHSGRVDHCHGPRAPLGRIQRAAVGRQGQAPWVSTQIHLASHRIAGHVHHHHAAGCAIRHVQRLAIGGTCQGGGRVINRRQGLVGILGFRMADDADGKRGNCDGQRHNLRGCCYHGCCSIGQEKWGEKQAGCGRQPHLWQVGSTPATHPRCTRPARMTPIVFWPSHDSKTLGSPLPRRGVDLRLSAAGLVDMVEGRYWRMRKKGVPGHWETRVVVGQTTQGDGRCPLRGPWSSSVVLCVSVVFSGTLAKRLHARYTSLERPFTCRCAAGQSRARWWAGAENRARIRGDHQLAEDPG